MVILGLDCGGTESRVSVSRNQTILAELVEPADRGKGDRFVPLIAQILQQADISVRDIDLIAVCSGPGSFTGIRIGVAAAQGLAFALNKPAIGIDAFSLYHFACQEQKRSVAVIIESKRDELYVQIYNESGCIISAAESMAVEAIQQKLNQINDYVLSGDASHKIIGQPTDENTASLACRFAAQLDPSDYDNYIADPFYIRPADVSLPK